MLTLSRTFSLRFFQKKRIPVYEFGPLGSPHPPPRIFTCRGGGVTLYHIVVFFSAMGLRADLLPWSCADVEIY